MQVKTNTTKERAPPPPNPKQFGRGVRVNLLMNNLQTLKTPCLILDIERVRQNAERVSEIAWRNGVSLRPHIKTHKCVLPNSFNI